MRESWRRLALPINFLFFSWHNQHGLSQSSSVPKTVLHRNGIFVIWIWISCSSRINYLNNLNVAKIVSISRWTVLSLSFLPTPMAGLPLDRPDWTSNILYTTFSVEYATPRSKGKLDSCKLNFVGSRCLNNQKEIFQNTENNIFFSKFVLANNFIWNSFKVPERERQISFLGLSAYSCLLPVCARQTTAN